MNEIPEKKYCQSHEKQFLNSNDLEKYYRFAFKDDMLKAISECLVMPIVNFLILSTDGKCWCEKVSDVYGGVECLR